MLTVMQSISRRGATSSFSLDVNSWNIRYGTSGLTYSDSNRRVADSTAANAALALVPKSTGKHYFEVEVIALSAGTTRIGIREALSLVAPGAGFPATAGDYGYQSGGNKQSSGGIVAYSSGFSVGQYPAILWDGDAGSLSFGVNGVDLGVAFSGIAGAYLPGVGGSAAGTDVRVPTTPAFSYPGYAPWR
jgi:hypothetical protein